MENDGRTNADVPQQMWLHLDVQTGCAGDMLCAALLHLGLKPGILRDGLARVGLHPAVGPKLTQTTRNGVSSLHLCFVDRHGRPIEGGPVDPPSAFVAQQGARSARRAPQAKRRGRTQSDVVSAGVEQETPEQDAAVISLHTSNEQAAPSLDEIHPAPDDVTSWLAGDRASGAALEARLAQGRLSPVAAALSRKALRRLLTGLGHVQGVPRESVSIEGRAAVDILCDVVGFACLIEALSPERVTASVVGVSTAQVRGGGGPEPWVVDVLKDVPTRERDQAFPACTPTGAALVWAVTQHFGARLGSVVKAIGVGAGTRDIRGVSNVARAFLGTLAVPASAGEMQTFTAELGAVADREAFHHALISAGASDLFFVAGTTLGGVMVERVTGQCTSTDAEEVTQVLLVMGGAASVHVAKNEVTRGDTETVSVRIGSPQKGDVVRLIVLKVGGVIRRVTVDDEDALAAARRLGWEREAVESAARLAFERQSSEDAGPDGPDRL